MTWQLYIFNFEGKPPDESLFNNAEFTTPKLGTESEILNKIRLVWPDIVSVDSFSFALIRNDCEIVFNLDEFSNTPISTLCLDVGYLEGYNPYPVIQLLCQKYQWSVFDCETNKLWDISTDTNVGLKQVQRRAQILLDDN